MKKPEGIDNKVWNRFKEVQGRINRTKNAGELRDILAQVRQTDPEVHKLLQEEFED